MLCHVIIINCWLASIYSWKMALDKSAYKGLGFCEQNSYDIEWYAYTVASLTSFS